MALTCWSCLWGAAVAALRWLWPPRRYRSRTPRSTGRGAPTGQPRQGLAGEEEEVVRGFYPLWHLGAKGDENPIKIFTILLYRDYFAAGICKSMDWAFIIISAYIVTCIHRYTKIRALCIKKSIRTFSYNRVVLCAVAIWPYTVLLYQHFEYLPEKYVGRTRCRNPARPFSTYLINIQLHYNVMYSSFDVINI